MGTQNLFFGQVSLSCEPSKGFLKSFLLVQRLASEDQDGGLS